MLTCLEITQLVTDFIEGQMGFLDRAKFRMHIAMCSSCRRYVSQVRTAIETLGQLPVEPPTQETMDALVRQFHAWKPASDAPPPTQLRGTP